MSRKEVNSQPQTVKLLVELEDSSPHARRELDRGEKYRRLVDDNRQKRQELIDWLRANDLADEVVGIGTATVFNYLYLEATRNIAPKLRSAPNVIHVSKVESITVELMTLDRA